MTATAGLDALEATLPERLAERRRRVAEQWRLGTGEVVLVGAGEPIPVPGRGDRIYPFRSHSEYLYLTDRERPGGVLAFDPGEGWIDFVVPVSRDELLWEGAPVGGTQDGTPISELPRWLGRRAGASVAGLGAAAHGASASAGRAGELRVGLNQVRRPKDELELARMRTAERATRAGFAAIRELLAPGLTERAVQIELESQFLRGGADTLAFDTIVGSGPNSAALHVAPSARVLGDGELVLIDAGGEYRGYASDVTRTYPVSALLSAEQAELHALVQRAVRAVIERCTPGTEFRELHTMAALVIAEGLVSFGLLRGESENLYEQGAVSLFFPHGIGHMVGLGVRDASERLAGREVDPSVFPGLRVDLPLEERFVLTVEPGIYFVPALLGDQELRARHRAAVDWDRAERMLGFGGIRIEQNVLVTADGPEVITADVPM
jgi:Xaa-Pro aminopeptidase